MEPQNAAERHRVLGEVVACLRVPALLVRGGDSDVITDEIAAEFGAIAPTGDVVTIPGARHMIAGDSNAPFTAAVLDFLERRIR
jgi:pimeloyl-ACP methyl ester carboxylesterase